MPCLHAPAAQEVFELLFSALEALQQADAAMFDLRLSILTTTAQVKSYLVLLDLERPDLLNRLFRTLFDMVT